MSDDCVHECSRFRDLPIGAVFTMDRMVESGLIIHRGQPGLQRHRKLSARTYQFDINGRDFRCEVGSINGNVWEIT